MPVLDMVKKKKHVLEVSVLLLQEESDDGVALGNVACHLMDSIFSGWLVGWLAGWLL